jgi:multiple sugar transport system permease protein
MATSTSIRVDEDRLAPRAPKATTPTRVGDRWVNRDWLPALGLLGPNIVMYSVFILIPIALAIALSFTSWGLVGVPHFIGLGNYRAMFSDPMVWSSIKTTLLFLLFGAVPTVILGMLLAILVNVQFRFIAAMRTLYFVPAVVSFAASAVLWTWIYRPGEGILDFLLYKVGIVGPAWLGSTSYALPALAIINIWLTLPVAIILYLAALQRIPEALMEAAMLDGAGPVSRLRFIIIPSLRNMTIVVAIVAILSFSNGSFDLVNIMTAGGPINATTTFIYYIYTVTFDQIRLGYAAALSLAQLLIFALLLGGGRLLYRVVSR